MRRKRGGGGGGFDLNIISRLGRIKVKVCFVRRGEGCELNFEPYFTHFPTPHPGNYCTVS